jgi:hypothetical protein
MPKVRLLFFLPALQWSGLNRITHICATGFRGLRSSLITFQIFVRLLHLIAQSVAELFNLTSGVRVRIKASRADDVSRGSLAGLEIR